MAGFTRRELKKVEKGIIKKLREKQSYFSHLATGEAKRGFYDPSFDKPPIDTRNMQKNTYATVAIHGEGAVIPFITSGVPYAPTVYFGQGYGLNSKPRKWLKVGAKNFIKKV